MAESLQSLLSQLESARQEALELIQQSNFELVTSRFLSRKGELRRLQQFLGDLDSQDRRIFGQQFNAVKSDLQNALIARPPTKSPSTFDFLPGIPPRLGRLHPITQTIEEITEIFGRMSFGVARGPEIEDVFHNFVALNVPEDHPARDPRDNFYIDSSRLLRSQTSTVQIRVLESQPPPIRMISIGRVYRPDTADATHSPMFHQVEGLYVDESATMATLKTILCEFIQAYLGPDARIRFRPSFFPFTEPSIEVDMAWGAERWIELGGAGMVDPQVFDAVGYFAQYTGFAFGFGVERLAMRRFGIDDLRSFYENDVRFLSQF